VEPGLFFIIKNFAEKTALDSNKTRKLYFSLKFLSGILNSEILYEETPLCFFFQNLTGRTAKHKKPM